MKEIVIKGLKTQHTKQEKVKFSPTGRSFICLTLVFLLTHLLTGTANGQIGQPKTPKPSTFTPVGTTQSYSTPKTNNAHQNQQIPPNQNDYRKKQSQQQMIRDIQNEQNATNSKPVIRYELPNYRNEPTTQYYRQAFAELSEMSKSKDYSIQRANFLTENAFYENQGSYEHFDKFIAELGKFIKKKMTDFGYNPNSNLDKNLILLQFFADTLKTGNLEHLPFKYDFNDYMAYDDWVNMFVEKLLSTNKGQCHSMPLLYMILAEEIEAKAHLSMSPNHSYIKFQDDNGTWVNVELTNGMLTTDAFILQSGYVKAEALQNKVYMQPLSKKELLAQIMVDLAKGYSIKYGYDSFVEEVLKKAIELYPNSMYAQLVMSDYKTLKFLYVAKQLQVPEEKINQYPKAEKLLKEMRKQYDVVDNLGFEEMPLAVYEQWLNSLNEEKHRQESQQMIIKLNNSRN